MKEETKNINNISLSLEGINYSIDRVSCCACVACSHDLMGAVVIPSHVAYEGVPYPVTSIAECALYGCEELTELTLPATLARVEMGGFMDCHKLSRIDVEKSNPNYYSVDGVLFEQDTNRLIAYPTGSPITRYALPEGTRLIAPHAFAHCNVLCEVVFPSSLVVIEIRAFKSCCNLVQIEFAEGLETIEKGVFCDCISLKEVHLPQSLRVVGDGVFADCHSLTKVILPDNLITLGDGVFFNCIALQEMILPPTLEYFGKWALSDCSALKQLTISAPLSTVGERCLMDCTLLTDIYVTCSQPFPIPSDFFFGVELSRLTLHVPQGAAASYQEADVWGEVARIVEQ